MQAAEIDEYFPVVDIDSSALEAARMLAEHSLPGIVVVTADGQLYAVLPASEVVRFIVPMYVQDAPLLAMRVAPLTPEYQQSAKNYAARLRACAEAELENLLKESADGAFSVAPAAAD